MILFFDTSALVKYFHQEEGTNTVVSLISNPDNEIWISELARLEFICAVYRRFRMKEINEVELSKIIEGFNEECLNFKVKKIGTAVLNVAEELVKDLGKTLGLRSLDAIHLGTFYLFKDIPQIAFVVADDILIKAAKQINAKIINPILGPKILL